MWFTPDSTWRKIQRDVCYVWTWRLGLKGGDPELTYEPCEEDVTAIKVTLKRTGEVTYLSALGLCRQAYAQQPQNASVILNGRDFNATN